MQAKELFSSRPFQFGSVAANTIEQYETALTYAEDGLILNPDSPTLHNSQAFALISLGRYGEALPVLSRSLQKFQETFLGPLTATAGMLALRLGEFDEGLKRYRKAISIFKRTGARIQEALAWAYFAQELARAERPEAGQTLQQAKDICKEVPPFPEAEIVLKRAELWTKAVAQRKQLSMA